MSRIRWQIQHRTSYTYQVPVRESFNEVRLKPPSNECQSLEEFNLTTAPPAPLRQYRDFYFNCVHHFEIPSPHATLLIESRAVVLVHPPPPLASEATPAPLASLGDFARSSDYVDYLGPSRFVDIEPATWRLAVDATIGIDDTWQAA